MNQRLKGLKQWTFNIFDALSASGLEYSLCFSGGKDSHALLGVYLEWSRLTGKRLNVSVVFSDTFLEVPSLYRLVLKAREICDRKIPFNFAQPDLDKTFWVVQFGIGYPVPTVHNRWCTGLLKINPMEALGDAIAITGSHLGESHKRDNKLSSCGSTECGIDLIVKKIDAIARWTNCDVWDYLLFYGDRYLYPGIFDDLQSTYAISAETNSLRMGCFMCPVVALSTIEGNVSDGILPPLSSKVRQILEELRSAPRILSPKTKKGGAILVDARISVWEKQITPLLPELLERGWISVGAIAMVEQMLNDRTYPPTYSLDWIKSQELLFRTV